MRYVVVENNQIMGIMPYEPNIPETSVAIEITDEEYSSIITEKTHYFDTISLQVVAKLQTVIDQQIADDAQRAINTEKRFFLENTDWKVMRHMREKALGQTTTLTDQEYLDLEQARATAAAAIIEIQ